MGQHTKRQNIKKMSNKSWTVWLGSNVIWITFIVLWQICQVTTYFTPSGRFLFNTMYSRLNCLTILFKYSCCYWNQDFRNRNIAWQSSSCLICMTCFNEFTDFTTSFYIFDFIIATIATCLLSGRNPVSSAQSRTSILHQQQTHLFQAYNFNGSN